MFQTRRTTTATETRPPTRRNRAAAAPAAVRRAARTWPAARLSRPPGPAAGPARPRRPEAPARSRTTPPPRRRISIWPNGRAARRENDFGRESVSRQPISGGTADCDNGRHITLKRHRVEIETMISFQPPRGRERWTRAFPRRARIYRPVDVHGSEEDSRIDEEDLGLQARRALSTLMKIPG